MTRRVVTSQRVAVPGPAGALEAAIDSVGAAPSAIAVLCHPHPLERGTMQNKVVTTLARAFAHLGAHAVRFNFRGVGESEGRYADGVGERADALAVAAWGRARWPGLELYLGGFSFGAGVALTSAAEARPQGLVTVAPPIEKLPPVFVPPRCPWLLVHGTADEVVPVAPTEAWVATLAEPPRLLLLDGVGHFFHGRLRELEDAVTEFFARDFRAEPP
jgi:uncharacterized protein